MREPDLGVLSTGGEVDVDVTESDPTESLSPKCFPASVGLASRSSKSWWLVRTRVDLFEDEWLQRGDELAPHPARISTIWAMSEMLAS